ncbi:hypothetical protein [Marinicellulosiphila megalodicopiae]|uniref:hypothetical protein n=1 Tax=Marinicellulosiphila megalodicopiae TaxID=2724896 RepID=UPI003BB0A741
MFISMRQIWNVVHFEGFTYNYDQRVQAFTHPSWVLLLSLITFATRELFYTNIVVSILLSLMSIIILLRYASDSVENKLKYSASIIVILSLVFSRSFTDYMTSGLENPLSFFLIGLIIYLINKDEQASSPTRLKFIFVLLALAFLNRFDFAVLLLPFTIYLVFIKNRFLISLKSATVGILIILSWFVFSTIYFGAPLPNTFYAKLGAAYPTAEYIERGFNYFEATYKKDPITLFFIALGVIVGLLNRSGITRSLAIGIILYCLYILKSGGDFMLSRFFSILIFISVFNILICIKMFSSKISNSILSATLVTFVFTFFISPLTNDETYSDKSFFKGVADERGYYYLMFGLDSPFKKWPEVVLQTESKPVEYQSICGFLGYTGLVNSGVYLIDTCALSDAFLARLPAIQEKYWRIGHHARKIPTNYGEFLINGTPIEDTQLQPMLDDVSLAVSGDLFTIERFKAIYRLNISKPYVFDDNKYKNPEIQLEVSNIPQEMDYDEIDHNRVNNGAAWDREGHIIIYKSLKVNFKTAQPYSTLKMTLDNNDRYQVYINGRLIKVIPVSSHLVNGGGVVNHSVKIPHNTMVKSIEIIPIDGDGKYSLGHLVLN